MSSASTGPGTSSGSVGAVMPTDAFVTTGLGSGGYDLRLRDSKNQNSNSNTDPFNNDNAILNPVVNLTLLVSGCAGAAVSGASVVVQSDHQRDQEPPSAGGELLGFTPGSQQAGFGEQPGNRVATVTTDSDGTARVKICTATYSTEDQGDIPRNGTWTMAVTINGVTTTFTSPTRSSTGSHSPADESTGRVPDM